MASRITSLSTTGGYLEQAPLKLPAGLTCIIGEPGTCKTTIAETIRFLVNADPARVADLLATKRTTPRSGLIRETLGDALARCEVEHDGIEPFTLERTAYDAGPRVLRDGDNDRRQEPRQFLDGIEILSQGDLQVLADEASRRLELLDRPNRAELHELENRRDNGGKRLRDIGVRLRVVRESIASRTADLMELAQKREKLEDLRKNRPQLSKALEAEREAVLKRKELLRRTGDAVKTTRAALLQVVTLSAKSDDLAKLARELVDTETPEARKLATIFKRWGEKLKEAKEWARSEADLETAPLEEALRTALEAQNKSYENAQRAKHAREQSLAAEDRLEEEVAELEKLRPEYDALRAEESSLVAERQRVRAELREIQKAKSTLRHSEAAEIVKTLDKNTRLELKDATDRSEYTAKLEEIFAGSGVRKDLIRKIAERTTPTDLIEIVEQANTERLGELVGRSKDLLKVVTVLQAHQHLYDMEAVAIEDKLEIFRKQGKTEKPVEALSSGQRAIALLPFVLRESDYLHCPTITPSASGPRVRLTSL